MKGPISDWSQEDVCQLLESLGLEHLKDAFKENGVNGKDILELTDDDYKDSLGCTNLQMKKIKRELEEYKDGNIVGAGSKIESGDATSAANLFVKEEGSSAAASSTQADEKSHKDKIIAAQNGVEKYSRAAEKLGSAEYKLQGAVKSLSITKVSGIVEMMGPGRGRGRFGRRNDFGHTMIEMGTVRKAQAAVQQAGAEIRQAQQLVPQLPFVKDANVQQAMSGVMLNALLMPGFAGDVMQQAKVTKAKREIQETLDQVVQSKQWCIKSAGAAQQQLTEEMGKMAL